MNRLKNQLLSLLCLCPLQVLLAQADLSGRWISEGEAGKGVVEIYKGPNGQYYGRLIKAQDPDQQKRIEQKMAEEGLSHIMILEDFVYEGENQWSGGTIFAPARWEKAEGRLELLSQDQLKVTGYKYWFSKSFVWVRL